MNFRDIFKKNNTISTNVYDNLNRTQKLAAMNLMVVFGGSCSGTGYELSKINHIMTSEGRMMEISGDEMRAGQSQFNGMHDMVDALVGANRDTLKKLFWAYYCIVAVGMSSDAANVLLGVYRRLGFSEQECLNILENYTGKKSSDL